MNQEPNTESSVSTTTPGAPPGWYDAPDDPSSTAYWDGTQWKLNLKCQGCGTVLSGVVCTGCGATNEYAGSATQPVTASQTSKAQEKSMGLALFLNFLWPGVGHLYAGIKMEFGIIFTIISGFAFLIGLTLILFPVSVIIWVICAPWTMIDIYRELTKAKGGSLA